MGGGKTSLINSTNNPQQQSSSSSISKPLVALLDGRDCSVEMPLLKVLNEAVAAFLYTIRISREDLVKFRSLKLLVKIGNPDLSNIDVDAATQLGIAVCNTPADALEETADHTMSLILNLYRRTYWLAQTSTDKSNPSNVCNFHLKNPQQLREGMSGTRRIRGQTLGIVGFGRVGCAVALRAKTFGFRVCFYDPNASLGMDRVFGVDRTENLTDLLTQSDCLTLHCKLTTETRLLLNNSTLDRLKPGAFLINTSDPDLIDQHALISFLKSGHVKAAALDIPCCGDNQQIESAGKIEGKLFGVFFRKTQILFIFPEKKDDLCLFVQQMFSGKYVLF
uniref:2-Hacid_dh_C domain-containing protein n=1 Tax=Meloidogyne hapla TaxID=6305 RepID=A0A1I8BDG5_MELHA